MKRDTTSTQDDSTSDIDDIVKRLTCTSDGCEVITLAHFYNIELN